MKQFLYYIIFIICFLTAGHSFSARTQAEKDYTFALGLQRKGLYRTAAQEYNAFLKNYPKNEAREFVLYNLGLVYKELGDEESGIKAWETLQTEFKDSKSASQTYFHIAEMYLDRGTELMNEYETKKNTIARDKANEYFEKAANAYDRFLKIAGAGNIQSNLIITAYYNIASCYERLSAYSKAVKMYEKLLKDFNDYEAQFKIGDVYLRYARAEKNYEAKKRYWDSALEGFRKTFYFGNTEFYDDAKIGYASVLMDRAEYEEKLAATLTKDGKNEEAQAKITLARSYYAMAREELKKEIDKKKFEQIYTQFSNNPNKIDAVYMRYLAPRAYWMIAQCYEREGNIEEAKKWLNAIVKNFNRSEFMGIAQKKLRDILEKEQKAEGINTLVGAKRAFDIAKNYTETGENEKAVLELTKLRRGFPGLREADFYNEYLYTLAYAAYTQKHYLEAGIAGEYLSKRVKASDMVESPEGKVSLMGQSLYYAGYSYWEYASGLKNEGAKGFYQLLGIKLLERMAVVSPSHPRSPSALLHAAGYYIDIKDYRNAAINYDRFISVQTKTEDPAYMDALFNLASCYISLEEYEKASKEYSKYIYLYDKKNHKVITAYDLLGGALIRAEKYADAINVFSNLRRENFKWVSDEILDKEYKQVFEDVFYQTGFAYYKMGNFEKAIENYAYFIDNFPDNSKSPKTRLLIAQLYFDKNDHENVVKTLGEFITKYKDISDAYKGYILLIESYLKTENQQKALDTEIEMFQAYGKEQLPKEAYATVAKIMKEANQIEGTRIAYQELITDYKDDSEVLAQGLWLSAEFAYETLQKLENEAESMTDEQKKTENEKQQKDFLSLAATHYTEYLKVASENLRAKTGDPNVVPARWFELQLRIGGIHERLGEYELAEKAYNKVVAQSKDKGLIIEAQYKIGHMWLKSGDPKKSLGTYLRLIHTVDKKDARTRKWIALSTFEAGVAYSRNNEPEKAKKMLDDFLKEFTEQEYGAFREEAEKILKNLNSSKISMLHSLTHKCYI